MYFPVKGSYFILIQRYLCSADIYRFNLAAWVKKPDYGFVAVTGFFDRADDNIVNFQKAFLKRQLLPFAFAYLNRLYRRIKIFRCFIQAALLPIPLVRADTVFINMLAQALTAELMRKFARASRFGANLILYRSEKVIASVPSSFGIASYSQNELCTMANPLMSTKYCIGSVCISG